MHKYGDRAYGTTGLKGKHSYHYDRYYIQDHSRPRYEDDTTLASYAEPTKQAGAITERLVGRLLRGLGVSDQYKFSD